MATIEVPLTPVRVREHQKRHAAIQGVLKEL